MSSGGRWAKLSASWVRRPEIVGLPLPGRWLYLCSLLYAVEHGTDGIVPANALRSFEFWTPRLGQQLIASGLWNTHPDGIEIAEFFPDQMSRAWWERQRERKRRNTAAWRETHNGTDDTPVSRTPPRTPPRTVSEQTRRDETSTTKPSTKQEQALLDQLRREFGATDVSGDQNAARGEAR